jgi:hypothetical protein
MQAKASFEENYPDVEIIVEQAADNFESMRVFENDPPDIMDSGGWWSRRSRRNNLPRYFLELVYGNETKVEML